MDWEIYDGQAQRGPMPESAVYDAIRAGLPRNAYVRQAGTMDWKPIDTHPQFAAVVQNRPAPGQWAPAPPPPPAMIGAPAPPVPEVLRPAPNTVYAADANAAQRVPRKLALGGCLVQVLAGLAFAGAVALVYLELAPTVVAAAVAGLGFVLLLVAGLLGMKWVCGACKQPVARKGAFMCPSCKASFT